MGGLLHLPSPLLAVPNVTVLICYRFTALISPVAEPGGIGP